MEHLSEKLYDFLARIPRSYYLPIALSCAGIVLLVFGLIQLLSSSTKQQAVEAAHTSSTQTTITPLVSQTLFGIQVDVEGAVVNPGVYKLPWDARVQDALIAAGGLSGDADRGVVARALNLAAKLIDGVKVYVPKIGENAAMGSLAETNPEIAGQTGLININSASESQLDSLPGVGPVTAQKIITGRPYGAIEDLKTKKVVSNSIFEKVKDKITIY